jgi:hypothetical protein
MLSIRVCFAVALTRLSRYSIWLEAAADLTKALNDFSSTLRGTPLNEILNIIQRLQGGTDIHIDAISVVCCAVNVSQHSIDRLLRLLGTFLGSSSIFLCPFLDCTVVNGPGENIKLPSSVAFNILETLAQETL